MKPIQRLTCESPASAVASRSCVEIARAGGSGPRPRSCRGLSLLELLLALTISAMVAGAIAGMLGAVSSGVGTRKDNRQTMVLAHAAQCRLAAYTATSKCVLAVSASDVTLWLDDSRESGTVHATEIRWLRFDASVGAIVVEYVQFPETWTRTACELADNEYVVSSDWAVVRAEYLAKGFLASRELVDHLQSVAVEKNETTAAASRHLAFALTFEMDAGLVPVQVSGTIQAHQAPAK
jgi:prepilin-type N-terminal cleavage/methylation domain-containing protein